jgi:cytochrome c oxidase cbb3-type subunit 3
MSEKHIDHVTGVETTGHVWDSDLRELNKPLPAWWLWTFYVCIVWSIGYWIVYPAWPTLNDYTRGIWGYSQRAQVMKDVADLKQGQAKLREALAATPLDKVKDNPELLRFAMTGGKVAFAENCAPCHGRGAQGSSGYPNLNDDDWLWGGKASDIQQSINVGVRSTSKDTRDSAMPKFGIDKMLDDKQISAVADHVLSLSGAGAANAEGAKIFAEQCVACHGENGKGNQELGAPNLTDKIWLYGGSKDAVAESIRTGRGGVMPAWGPTAASPKGRLDQTTIKSLALYVHSLGGGK